MKTKTEEKEKKWWDEEKEREEARQKYREKYGWNVVKDGKSRKKKERVMNHGERESERDGGV